MFYFVLFARRFREPNFSPINQLYSQRLDFETGKKRLQKIQMIQQTLANQDSPGTYSPLFKLQQQQKNTNDIVITISTEATINQNRNCHMLPCCLGLKLKLNEVNNSNFPYKLFLLFFYLCIQGPALYMV